MRFEDSIVLGLFVLAFPAVFFLLRKRQKQGTKVIEAAFEIDASAPTEIDARLSVGSSMHPNVLGKGRCAKLYRAASSDRRERP